MLASVLLFVACGGGTNESVPPIVTPPITPPVTPPVTPPATDAPALTRTVLLQGLNSPWDVAVAADGAMFFTEKCRGLSVRRPDGTVARLFGTSGSSLVAADLQCVGQSGVHGIALDPGFAANRTLYVYMLSNFTASPRTNRVVRLVVDNGYTTATSRTDIVIDIAFKESANGVGSAGAHSGGRLRFGPDGFLYVTTGDNHNPTLPQSPTMIGGKVCASPARAPPRQATQHQPDMTGASSRRDIATCKVSRSALERASRSPPSMARITATR